MGVAERKILNVMEMRYLRSMHKVTGINQVRNEEVQRKANVTTELAGQTEQSVLRWFGQE